AVRDSLLVASGERDCRLGGASVPDDGKNLRRSLYLFQKRDVPPAMSSLFDGPSAVAERCPRRHVSTEPLHALYMRNNECSVDRARGLARRVEALAGDDCEKQIETAFVLALGRPPDAKDREASRLFFERVQPKESGGGLSPLAQFCQALMSLNEF